MRFISHKDLINVFKRAVVRARIPVAHSAGFNPRPKLSFYNPLPVGVESVCEVFSMVLGSYVSPPEVRRALNAELPEGLYCMRLDHLRSKREIRIFSSEYRMPVSPAERKAIEEKLPLVDDAEFYITRERNGKRLRVRDTVGRCFFADDMFHFSLRNISSGALSAKEFLEIFFPREEAVRKMFQLTRYGVNGERTP